MILKIKKQGSTNSKCVTIEQVGSELIKAANKGLGKVTIIKSDFHNSEKDFTVFFCEQLND